ncbi:hypothetical protein [Pectinatus haikarae]|uniref:Glycosyltransferase RgtA/B/C/D-like domain-containing protein n=1 Tax=Pectinatus haikarae TaxID=349096 RepID=A0ABT9Y9Z4_9FIRM|nr:hypothetical protein [Pectinatus haikarae]MDQ0204315.1 hypothetical protein [Pectinatus haikarae]
MLNYKNNIVQKNIYGNSYLLIILIILIIAIFASEIIYGLLLMEREYFPNEAYAITAIADKTMQMSHFSFEGIILNLHPLLVLLEIPILWILSFFPVVLSKNISGIIVASFFSTVSAAYLFYKFKNFNTGIFNALFLTLLFILNPFLFHYGAIGVDVSFFSTILLICSGEFSDWLLYRKTSSLVIIALAMVICLFNNYEIIIIACIQAIMIAYSGLFMIDPLFPFKNKALMTKINYTVSTLVVVLLPFVYTIFIMFLQGGIFWNTPFYFVHVIKDTIEITSISAPAEISELMRSYYSSFGYVVKMSVPFLIIFGAITFMRICVLQIVRKDYLLLLFFIFMIIIFNTLGFKAGLFSDRLYNFYYIFPICAGWIPYEINQLPYKAKRYGVVFFMMAFIICGFLMRSIL